MNELDKLSLMIKDLLESQGVIQSIGGNSNQISFEVSMKDYHQAGNTSVYDEDIYTIDIKRKEISNV
jgi:hypothetical protein